MLEQLEHRCFFSANSYLEQNLTSDGAVSAAHTDTHLINPWGLVAYQHGFEVADAGTDFTTSYDANGNSTGPVVSVPGTPTGIALNSDVSKFKVNPGSGLASAQFLFATIDGTIEAWPTAGGNHTVVTAVNHSGTAAVYKGIAIAKVGASTDMFVANFGQRRIDVFNSSFGSIKLTGNFTDPHMLSSYSPFNIALIGGKFFVTYAKHMNGNPIEGLGAGLGIVDEFNTNGTFVKRFATGKTLNAPWGMALAPSNFGAFSGDLLIGNFGDGKINAFDPVTGAFKGQMDSSSGTPIAVSGLWGLAFGNGKAGTIKNALYFAAGTNLTADGLYGRLLANSATPASNPAPSPPPSGNGYVWPMAVKQDSTSLFDGLKNG